jgi:hypothetical protein
MELVIDCKLLATVLVATQLAKQVNESRSSVRCPVFMRSVRHPRGPSRPAELLEKVGLLLSAEL